MRVKKSPLGKNGKLFSITASTYRSWWSRAAESIFGKKHGTYPHMARHTGASRDLSTAYRTFEQVQRRGRWKVPTSVQRYAKTHAWRAINETVPSEVVAKGGLLLQKRAARPKIARE